MPDTAFENVLTPDYRERRDSLAKTFPTAHRFFLDLEALHETDARFHLGTAQNVHVYSGNRYLCYIRIERARKGPVLVIRAEPHQGRIKDGTQSIEAPAFVKRIEKLISEHHGYGPWGDKRGVEYWLDARTPESFFTGLVALVKSTA